MRINRRGNTKRNDSDRDTVSMRWTAYIMYLMERRMPEGIIDSDIEDAVIEIQSPP